MYLKLRVPFFADFDKKTLKFIMERTGSSFFKKGKIVQEYGHEADHMLMVIDGELSCFFHKSVDQIAECTPDLVIGPGETWGDDALTDEITWEYSVKATKKALVMNFSKKDLIEVL